MKLGKPEVPESGSAVKLSMVHQPLKVLESEKGFSAELGL